MPKKRDGYVGLFVELPEDLDAALRLLATETDRSIQAEVIDAIRRHLARPPKVVRPPLAASTVERAAEPKKRPGRPAKKSPPPP